MFKSIRIPVCDELNYQIPCLLPANNGLFIGPKAEHQTKKTNLQRLAVCSSCLVSMECRTDAVNSVLDIGNLNRNAVFGYAGCKSAVEILAIAKDSKCEGYKQVTLDKIADYRHTPLAS